ncbi:lipopolysaccharide transport periplasmic protein LptA [Undibacterium sp. RuTC16W]|uniref:lipopolysaccharide transport periplasmic protein LptA n=1 Tax=Undibacterium sp. RuTC16W TaxID=3413048 RepID=UPI003BEFE54D
MRFQYKEMKCLSHCFMLAIGIFTVSPAAFAEKADSLKKTAISAEHLTSDGKKSTSTLLGEVILVRGTLLVKADRAVVTEAADGHQTSVLYANAGGRVSFRQKRDGGPDLWVDGYADRVEYDDRSELVKFISKAKIRYLDGKNVTQEQEGEYLSYDSINDVFVATNSTSGKQVPGGGRVTLILEPKADKQTKE